LNVLTFTFGDRITKARRVLGLTQAELAARVGVHLNTIVLWESDKYRPRGRAADVYKLAEALECDVDFLDPTGDVRNRYFTPDPVDAG
jgi:transcriptional regulator with XRE-family HTH domain